MKKNFFDILRQRNPLLVIVFSLLTFGLYYLYWFYDTNAQFKRKLEDGSNPVLRTFAVMVPMLNIVAMFKHSKSSQDATGGHDWLLTFLAYLVFPPIAWFVVQSDINQSINT